jgi:hypothetical protein
MTLNPAAVQSLVKNLFGVAITGIKNIPWPSEDAAQLAAFIADMVIENERLKALLGLKEKDPPAVVCNSDTVRFAFGPDSAYMLQLPAGTAEQRKALAANLEALAKGLRETPETKISFPGQMNLPFNR